MWFYENLFKVSKWKTFFFCDKVSKWEDLQHTQSKLKPYMSEFGGGKGLIVENIFNFFFSFVFFLLSLYFVWLTPLIVGLFSYPNSLSLLLSFFTICESLWFSIKPLHNFRFIYKGQKTHTHTQTARLWQKTNSFTVVCTNTWYFLLFFFLFFFSATMSRSLFSLSFIKINVAVCSKVHFLFVCNCWYFPKAFLCWNFISLTVFYFFNFYVSFLPFPSCAYSYYLKHLLCA